MENFPTNTTSPRPLDTTTVGIALPFIDQSISKNNGAPSVVHTTSYPTTSNPTTNPVPGNLNTGNPNISNIYNTDTYISNINNTYINHNIISNIHNIHFNATHLSHTKHIDYHAIDMAEWIIIGLGLLVTLLAIFVVFSLVKKDHAAAPVFIINLLLSDLVQLCSLISQFVQTSDKKISNYIYLIGAMASIEFMVCVSMERYLVIAWPLWYRCRRNIKTSLVICVIVWVVPIIVIPLLFIKADYSIQSTITGIFLLLPFPLLIFFLFGTLRALSEAISVPADEKRRIVAILVLVPLIYTLLFLPPIIGFLVKGTVYNDMFRIVVSISVSISPLADSTLYILMKKSVLDKVFASLCCCKKFKNQQTESVDNRLQVVDAAVSSSEKVKV